MHPARLLKWAVAAVLVLLATWAQATERAAPVTEITQALVQGLGPPQAVTLPHKLAAKDFDRQGGLVTYRLTVNLPVAPERPLGIYVPKIALSGNLYINGQLYGSCERGALDHVRCLHRPHLFGASAQFWRAGPNELRFEIYADGRQSNGLSSVWVGDLDALDRDFYQWRDWLQVDLLAGLTWLSALLGVLALAVGAVLRKDSVYIWFGLTSLANAAANSSLQTSQPPVDADAFSWLIFVSRFVSGHLLILMFATFFEKLTPRVRNAVLGYVLLAVVGIGLSDNNRTVVTVLYLPLLLAVLAMPALMLYWSRRSRQPRQVLACVLMAVITAASSYDWLKFTGVSSFVDLYLIPYAYGGVLFMFGATLLTLLAMSLVQTQQLGSELELRVAQRTLELEQAHARLLATETQRVKMQERQDLMQDMHDGFGSQLVIAKMMVEQNTMSQAGVAQLLDESISDLYLIVDALGNTEHDLETALVDFRFRVQKRLANAQTRLHWNLDTQGTGKMSQRNVLHLLRIIQEALNNALKHARAQNIWIDLSVDAAASTLTASVRDDGAGLRLSQPGGPDALEGRGQKSMLVRSRLLNAELSWHSEQPGTRVALRMPLH
jgi:signal transduction histidine kinase